MAIKVEQASIILKLNKAIDKESFSRIFYFRNAIKEGVRLKVKFKRIDELTYESSGFDDGIGVLQDIIGSDERSHLDYVRLLNRGGAVDLDIAHIEFFVNLESDKTGKRTVSVLSGDVNKVLKTDRDAITLDTCNPGLRATMAFDEADMTGIKVPYSVDPKRLTDWFEAMKAEHEATLYNNIQDGKRIGWAILSRSGDIGDIHGRRYEKYSKEAEFHTPTPIYNGYMQEILEDLKERVGTIFRARLIGIKGFREIVPHHDGHDGTLFHRFHIPIIPNKRCIFSSAGRDFVMDEPGQLYQFPAWETHSVVNYDGDRVHLLFSANREFPAA
jgi:hypothetical protein